MEVAIMADVDGEKAPLSHIRVLDITEFLAGPFATQILGDLGAEVIKIESPQGDSSRHIPPNFVAGSSTYFTCINRNKYSLVVDLKSAEGVEIVRSLAGRCDVLIENRRPGVLDRLGLSYEELARINPELIWCSISGFGQDGPDRDAAAYDMVVQAISGGMSLTGEKNGRPVRAGVPIGDIGAGLYGVIGVLAALAKRGRTGRGNHIDISMLDVQVAFLNYQASQYLNGGKVPGPQGREHDFLPTYRCFATRDGREVAVTANTERMWRDMCRVLGRPELVDDARFVSVPERNRYRSALIAELEAAFKAKDASEWVALMRAAGVPIGPINTIDRALAEPQVLHRDMVIALAGDDTDQRARVVGNPIKMKNETRKKHRFPPRLGADTRYVLGDVLSYSAERITALIDTKVVGVPEAATDDALPASSARGEVNPKTGVGS
jgi:crotonobetainyl-CoA:carnitine CoA-transferase CaiB-like acyl-CoA transferase